MAQLRHFAIVVRDQGKSPLGSNEQAVRSQARGLRGSRWSSAIYLSDGVVNLALSLHRREGSGRET